MKATEPDEMKVLALKSSSAVEVVTGSLSVNSDLESSAEMHEAENDDDDLLDDDFIAKLRASVQHNG